VSAWLESQGLKVDRVARGRHWISFSGTAHLAPYGTLQGDICLSSATTLAAKTYTVCGVSELGNTMTATPGLFTAADGSLAPTATARQGQTAVAYMTGDGDPALL
jgi:hypothetical protein